MSKLIMEEMFSDALKSKVRDLPGRSVFGFVTGPGRSGAVASVYVSHLLGVPFLPFGLMPGRTKSTGRIIVVDTTINSGRTMRKALRKYQEYDPYELFVYDETITGRLVFWYEEV